MLYLKRIVKQMSNHPNQNSTNNTNTNLTMDTTNYLSKEEYYKNTLTENTNTILYKYHSLIVDCLNYSIANITKLKRKQLDFVLLRCYDTITHVFLNILFYTKNVNIVLLYCQKACYFYVEFVNQITDEQNNFLQLGSRDACIYVYKKIFSDINMEHYKSANAKNIHGEPINSEQGQGQEDVSYFIITEYTKLCKTILLHFNDFISFEPVQIVRQFKKLENITNDYSKLGKTQIQLYTNWVCIVNDFFISYRNHRNQNELTNLLNAYVDVLLLFIKYLDKKNNKKNKQSENFGIQKLISNETKEKIFQLLDNLKNDNNYTKIINEIVKCFFE